MNGAQALLRTLVSSGVDVCFGNPGTSEMHFVAALDDVPAMRAVLGLFEGVVTGAADGYGRMAARPAATLLHLGPGLGNGLANLHNARRARTPVVNIVGDHALHHKELDAPLESDIDALAWSVSSWVRRSTSTRSIAADGADAVAAARTAHGCVATLILAADVSWSDGASPAPAVAAPRPAMIAESAVDDIARVMRSGSRCAVLVGGQVMTVEGLAAIERVCRAVDAKAFHETFPARISRGGGRVQPERLNYLGELAVAQLRGFDHLILVDTVEPVSFFAYPGKPGRLTPDGCEVHVLAAPGTDAVAAVEALADAVAGVLDNAASSPERFERPTGPIDAFTAAAAVAATLPENAIVSDEAATSGIFMLGATKDAPSHDWLSLTGGAIGQGMPVATGAAIACPDRPVLNLQADGSAMYTIQALWTQAREGLDVTTLICNNRAYAILAMELDRVGASVGGTQARSMLELDRPNLDFCRLAEGMGVPAVRVTDAETLCEELARAYREPGPHVIEAMFVR